MAFPSRAGSCCLRPPWRRKPAQAAPQPLRRCPRKHRHRCTLAPQGTHAFTRADHTYDARVMRPRVPTPPPGTPCVPRSSRVPAMAGLRPAHPAAPPVGPALRSPCGHSAGHLWPRPHADRPRCSWIHAPGQARQTPSVCKGPGRDGGPSGLCCRPEVVAAGDLPEGRVWRVQGALQKSAWPAGIDGLLGAALEPFSPRAREHLKRGQCERRTET